MALGIGDRVKETTTTTGTGTVTLLGAATAYRAFSAICATGDTVYYCIVGQTSTEWEAGKGTYTLSGTTLARTTVLASSNSGSLVSFSAGTKDVFCAGLAERLGVQMLDLAAQTDPSPPDAGNLYFYSKLISGRMMPKWLPPSGLDVPVQPAFFGNRMMRFTPQNGSTGTGGADGPAWTSNGTVNTPTPSATAPAMSNQMKRTRYANIVTTTNQQLGPRGNSSTEQQFWIGNAAGLGGFFFMARFIVELYPGSTVRIFAGLTSSSSGSVCTSDVVLANSCGLWHDSTDPSSGANSFNFVTKNASTETKQSIALTNAIAAGNSYDFYMFCKPNDTTIYYRLDDIVNAKTYEGSTSTTIPVNTAFMQAQVQMSNATAWTVVTTVAIGIVGIYVESDH